MSTAATSADAPASALSGLRVIDLTDTSGYICGHTLAQLGADVIKVERPGGDADRATAPASDTGVGFAWWALNSGKRGVTLDLATVDGRSVLRRLLDTADVVIESGERSLLASLGLDQAQLAAEFPRLIVTSISPYGATGPRAGSPATDLTVQALGGHMYVTGDEDRSPVRVGLPVSGLHAGVEAAAMTLVAVYERQTSGLGQYIDVSMQECLLWTMLNTTMTWELTGRIEGRGGAVRKERASTIMTRLIWDCADGLVHFVPVGGGGGRSRVKSWDRFASWMESEGFGAPILRARDWNGADQHSMTQEEYDAIAAAIKPFLMQHTVAELYDRAVVDGLLLAPVSTVREALASRQLVEREYFQRLDDDQLGEVAMPGAFARLSVTPLSPLGPPPHAGQHNEAVLGELLSDAERRDLTARGIM